MEVTIGCSIVIRNESDKILRCLQKAAALAEQIVVVDTGSTDGTPAMIREWSEKYCKNRVKVFEVGNQFHDEDGDFHFGNAKNFGLQQLDTRFVMWLDANDEISDPRSLRRIIQEEAGRGDNVMFVLPTRLSEKFSFVRIRCAPKDSCMIEGRVHEYMKPTRKLRRVFVKIPIENRKRGRDLNRNLKLLIKDWNETQNGRTAFYIAQSYRELGNPSEAVKWFRKRIYSYEFKNVFPEEYFKSLESMCELLTETMHPGWTAEDVKEFAGMIPPAII